MTATDRGAERRRLLAAVREDGDADSSTDVDDRRADPPEPAPDGGRVICDAPLYHCSACGRTYLEQPADCRGCGGSSFDRRTAE